MEGKLKQELEAQIKKIFDLDFNVVILRSHDSAFGDFSSPSAMQLAAILKKSPRDIATQLVDNWKIDSVSKIEVAGNGYINFYMNSLNFKEVVNTFTSDFGKGSLGKGKKIMVEFGQPNTHKQITVGHVKSAITGLSIARLHENAGFNVIKANYFGDLGKYVATCLYGILEKDLGLKLSERPSDLDYENATKFVQEFESKNGLVACALEIGNCYSHGAALYKEEGSHKEIIEGMNVLLFKKENEKLNELYDVTRDVSIRYQDKFFSDLGVKYDRQYPESEVWENGLKIVKENTGEGKIFFEDTDGSVIFPGEKYKLHRYVFITQKGVPTYSAKDLGLAVKKFQEYPDLDLSLITTSIEQSAYFDVVIKALTLIYPQFEGKYKHIGFGWLLFGNKKLSSRMGKKLDYEGIISEMQEIAKKLISGLKNYSEEEIESISKSVAISSFKFAILSHEFHKDINYDPESFVSFTGYSAPYILYAYARANSILEKANYSYKTDSISNLEGVFNTEEEQELLKMVMKLPEEAEVSAKKLSTHLLCKYVFNLSEIFNKFYNKYQVLTEDDNEIKDSRLALIWISKEVIKSVLYLLGIEVIEKM